MDNRRSYVRFTANTSEDIILHEISNQRAAENNRKSRLRKKLLKDSWTSQRPDLTHAAQQRLEDKINQCRREANEQYSLIDDDGNVYDDDEDSA
jgi:hypothetical protein